MDEVDKMRESIAVVLVVAALVIGVALFDFWTKNREKPYLHSIEILPGKSYEGAIKHDGGAEPRIEWKIDGGPVKIAIFQENREIFSTEDLQGSFSLKDRPKGIYRFLVGTEKPVEINYTLSYRYIGMAGTPLTFTKDIIIEEKT